jgi:hypothetical protein
MKNFILEPSAIVIKLAATILVLFADKQINNNLNGGLFFKDYMGKVVDVTIAYPNGQPLDLWNIVSGSRPPCVTHVHYRVFDIKEVNQKKLCPCSLGLR